MSQPEQAFRIVPPNPEEVARQGTIDRYNKFLIEESVPKFTKFIAEEKHKEFPTYRIQYRIKTVQLSFEEIEKMPGYKILKSLAELHNAKCETVLVNENEKEVIDILITFPAKGQ